MGCFFTGSHYPVHGNQARLDQVSTPVANTPPRQRRADAVPQGTDIRAFAFALFILMIVFTLLSVPSRLPMLGVLRPTVLLVALISLLILASAGQAESRDTSRTTRYLNLLILYVVITIPFVQWPGSVLFFGIENFIKAVVFFYFAVYLVTTFRRLQIFIMTILTCQIIRVLEPLYLHLTTGYWGSKAHMGGGEFMARLSGAPHDIVNPNGLAFVVLTALPFLHYLFGGSPKRFPRLLYLALLPPMLYAFILTGSRSGMIGLLVVFAVIFIRSKQKLFLGAFASVAVVGLLGVMSADLTDRYRSITDHDTRNAATAEGRFIGVKKELQVGLRRPVFGHGLGTSRETLWNFTGNDQISHNLYTEVFIELGIIGLMLYLAFLFSVFANVRSVGLEKQRLVGFDYRLKDPTIRERLEFYERLAEATLAFFIMALVFSLASYGLSEFYWYMIAGLSVAVTNLMRVDLRQLDVCAPGQNASAPVLGSASIVNTGNRGSWR